MKKVRYTCAEWGDEDGYNTGICRDFYPSSVEEDETDEAYLEFQRQCEESAREGTDFYREQGCKRSAHMMLPYGRSGTRYGPPGSVVPPQSGEPYQTRLTALQTPLPRRTQSDRWQPGKDRKDTGTVDRNVNLTGQVEDIIGSVVTDTGSINAYAYDREAFGDLMGLAEITPLNKERLAKLSVRIREEADPLRVYDVDASRRDIPPGLFLRVMKAINTLNLRLSRMIAGSNIKSRKIALEPDAQRLAIRVSFEDRKYQPSDLDANTLKVVALNGNTEPFDRLREKARDPSFVIQRQGSVADRYASYNAALLLNFIAEATRAARADATGKGRVSITVEDDSGRQKTLPSVSMRGLQHSDVLQRYDPQRKSYYTFRNLTKRDVAEYLLGLQPPTRGKRKKRRGRSRKPLQARDNPVARPSFINIDEYRDLAPGTYRPIPSRPKYCVYRKVVKGPVPTDEEFRVTTCKRAQSWQDIRPENQLARLVEEASTETTLQNPRRAPMGRHRKNFDPLAELMAEFGPTARLGKRQKRGAPNFDRRIRHKKAPGKGSHYDPYAQSIAPYGSRTSLPTNRRNPRSMTPAQAEFAENSRRAAELMRDNGMSRKQAWNVIRNNPDDTRYFRQSGYHTKGPFVQDFKSQYEMRRGAYGPSLVSPPVNRRNPSMSHMGGAELEARANQGDGRAMEEIMRRQERRAMRAEKRQARRRSRKSQRRNRDFYKP